MRHDNEHTRCVILATREEVRTAFYAELESAADGVVDPSSITGQYPETDEQLPAIVHNDGYRNVPMNNNTGPKDVVYDDNGDADIVKYSILMQAQFNVLIMATSEIERESIYHAIRTHFEPYTLPIKDESDIQDDVHRVEVLDSNSQDDEERKPSVHGDSLSINLGYERIVSRDVDSIDSITIETDTDTTDTGDGTTDSTRTTN